MNIIFIGFKKSGKTTIASALAADLKRAFIDTDRLVEEHFQETQGERLVAHEIYKIYGEVFFRSLEQDIVASLAGVDKAIIACGGGTVLDSKNILALDKLGTIIYLRVAPEVLIKRHQHDRIAEFLDPQDFEKSFYKTYAEREAIYQQVANITIDATDKGIDETIKTILEECYVK